MTDSEIPFYELKGRKFWFSPEMRAFYKFEIKVAIVTLIWLFIIQYYR